MSQFRNCDFVVCCLIASWPNPIRLDVFSSFAMFFIYLIIFHQLVSVVIGGDFLIEKTSEVFGDNDDGLIAAFGDYNSDKFVDIFIISNQGKTLQIFMAYDVEPILRASSFKCDVIDGIITSVVPGDYDGDSEMDILMTVRLDGETQNEEFRIIWGSPNLFNCSSEKLLTGKIHGQPLVFDYNGDRIPDLFAEAENRERRVWIMSKNRSYTTEKVLQGTGDPLRVPHSHAFIDLNDDMTADLLVTTENGYEIWYNQHGILQHQSQFSNKLPKEVVLVGQSVVTDFDMNGLLDHLVPVCFDKDCFNSAILIYDKEAWRVIDVNFQNNNVQWGFVPPLTDKYAIAEDTISLRVGDFNLDGFPDFLAVLRSKSNPDERMATLLLNVEGSVSGGVRRAFTILWDAPHLKDIKDVQLAAFYDAYNDGIVDVLVVRKNDWKLMAFKNNYDAMACFIKVIVSSGLCYNNCPNAKIPYGVNQPGPAVCYKSTTPEGDPQTSCAGLLSQSAHFSLQLPYIIFGLGHTPNFVDSLTVGIPYPQGQVIRSHDWTGIIPNSQMFVVPYLENENVRWLNKLFVTPSHLVLITFAALMGVMGFIFFIILGLHWKERVEDRKEKLQEAHRFHFDAM